MQRVKHLVFDLDQTIWRETIEWTRYLQKPTIGKSNHAVLRYFHHNNYKLYIASRSAKPDTCHSFIDKYLPDIHFRRRAIFPTNYPTKTNHIHMLGLQKKSFAMFDDEKVILKHMSTGFPQSTPIHCDTPLNWSHVVRMLELTQCNAF
jgi:hypothetical protein